MAKKKNIKMLVVDIDSEIVMTMQRYLRDFKQHNVEVEHSSDLQEALEHVNKSQIDMVVLDIGLPDMNGLSCLKALKSINQNAKILISTGSYAIGDDKEVLALGSEAVLSKPYRLIELLSSTQRILNRQSL